MDLFKNATNNPAGQPQDMASLGRRGGIRPGYGSNVTICYADEVQNNMNKSAHLGSRGRARDSRSERKNSDRYFISFSSG